LGQYLKTGHVALTTPLLGVVCRRRLEFDTVYPHANLTILALVIPEIWFVPTKFYNGSRDLTTPLSGMVVVRGLVLATINLPNKCEVYLHPLRRYERRYKMSKLGWF